MKIHWPIWSAWFTLGLFISSCQENKDLPTSSTGFVTFEISNGQILCAQNQSNRSIENTISVVNEMYDVKFASYAEVMVDEVRHALPIKQWAQAYKKDLSELDPSHHERTEFIVYNPEGTPLFATPKLGSEFENFLEMALPITFDVLAYEKIENPNKIQCIEEFESPLFGFDFRNIDLKSIKTLCVFANYCDPETGLQVASITAQVFTDPNQTSPEDLIWIGAVDGPGEPLCIKLPYDPDLSTEEQTQYVVLLINHKPYAGAIDLAYVDAINTSDNGYLHLNPRCEVNVEPFKLITP